MKVLLSRGGRRGTHGDRHPRFSRPLAGLLCTALLLMAARPVFAVPLDFYNWNTGDGNWSNSANWDTGTVPPSLANTVIQFGGGATFTSTNDLAGNFNMYAVVIDYTYTGFDSTLAASMSGQVLVGAKNDLYTGAIQMDGSGSFNINENLRIGPASETFTIHGNDGQLWLGNNSAVGFTYGQGNVNLNGGVLKIDGAGGSNSYVAIGSPGGSGGVISNGGLNPGSVEINTAGNGLSVYLFGASTYTGGTNLTAGNLVVGNNSALGSGTLTVSEGGPKSLRAYDDASRILANAVNLDSDITLGGGVSLTSTLTLSGPVQLGGSNPQVQIDVSTSDVTISGDISGTSGLIKNGDGTLILSGTNSYDVGTTVEGGTLRAGSAGAFVSNTSAANYTVNGGTLDLNGFDLDMVSLSGTGGTVDLGSADLTIYQTTSTVYEGNITGAINGTGSLTKSGSGSLSLTGANDYSGGTTLSDGELLVGNDSALGTGAVTLAGGTTFGVTSGSSVFLGNNVTINGDISIEVGNGDFIQFLGETALGSTTRQITFTQDGSDVCFMGGITGTGGVTFAADTGINALVEYCGDSKDYSGLTTVTDRVKLSIDMDPDEVAIAGDLQIDSGGSVEVFGLGSTTTPIASTSNVTLNGDLVFFSNYAEQQTLASLNGSGTLTNGKDGLAYESLALTVLEGNFSGVLQEDPAGGALSLIKSGSGTLTLSGANTYTGGTELTGGKLVAASSSAFGTGAVTVTGASTTLSYADGVNLGNEVFLGDNMTIEVAAGSAEQSGSIYDMAGSFGISKIGAGSLTISGDNAYSGGTTLAAGKLVAANSNAFGFGTVTVTGTSTTLGYADGVVVGNEIDLDKSVSLEVTSGSAEQYGDIIETGSPVSVTKIGTGSLTLSGLNDYTGGTNLNEGTLLVWDDYSLGGETGGTLTLGNGTTFGVADYNNAFLSQAVKIAGNISIQTNDTTYLEFDGDVDLGASTRELKILGDGGQTAFAGVISGAGGLSLKAGDDVVDGVQVAMGGDAANTYTGPTTVGDRVQLYLAKDTEDDPSAVAIKGSLTIENGGQVLTVGTGQIASDSDVTVETGGYLGFGMLEDGDVQTIGSLSGGGTVEPFLADMTLRVGSGNFSGTLQDTYCGCSVLTFEKYGAGTLTLSGVNTYSGGTTITAGILSVGNNSALGTGAVKVLGGTLLVQKGTSISNVVQLAGGVLSKELAGNGSLAHAADASSGEDGTGTKAEILDGTLTGSATDTVTLESSFSDTPTFAASNDEDRIGSVYHLSGMSDIAPGVKDTFVLQLTVAGVDSNSYLGWLNGSNTWVNAIEGNTGNNAIPAMQGFNGSFDEFVAMYSSFTLSQYIGAYGYDEADDTVWAVLNHNSDFAVVAAPEPTTWVLLVAGLLVVGITAKRRRLV